MAKQLDEQLEIVTKALFDSWSRVGPGVVRYAIRRMLEDMGLEPATTMAADTGDAFIDDGDDEGITEYFETQVKNYARGKIINAMGKLDEWAKSELPKS